MATADIVSIVSVVVSVLSLCGIGYATKAFWENKAEKKKQSTEEYKRLQKEERKAVIKEAVKEELKPIKEDISVLTEDVRKLKESDDLQKESLQAVLRDRLYKLYNTCTQKGFASFDDRENFENMYVKYHSLGANGVMDDIYKKFLHLPVVKKDD